MNVWNKTKQTYHQIYFDSETNRLDISQKVFESMKLLTKFFNYY